MYAVAAAEEQPGPPPVKLSRWSSATTEPVGTQHAAAHRIGAGPPPLALCGADLTGWIVFPDRRFDLGCTANCQRCAQLVAAAVRAYRADLEGAGRSGQ